MRKGIRRTGIMLAAAAAVSAALTLSVFAESFTAAQKTMYVTADVLNMRTEPDTGSESAGTLSRGTAVTVTGTGSEWMRISVNGQQYYAAAQYLSDSAPAAAAPETQAAAANADVSLPSGVTDTAVSLSSGLSYAEFSKIHSGSAHLYKNTAGAHGDITVCVNAGHGTKGGGSVKTLSHPDGTGKVTGGTNAAGAVTSMAVSSGMEFADGTAEAKITLKEARLLRAELLDRGYSVLMIREDADVQLDNIARTVLANNYADCHVAIHWDSSTSDKGAFFMSVPDALKNMEPVKSDWEKSEAFGTSLIAGLKGKGVKIFGNGSMDMDLTQTSYSTVPSVDLELGDKVSDHGDAALKQLAAGIADGIEAYFRK